MGRLNLLRSPFVVILFAVLALGAADNTLPDIQSAILQNDYQKSRDLAKSLAGQTQNPMEKAAAQYYLGLSELRLGDYKTARDEFRKVTSGSASPEVALKAHLGFVDSFYLDGNYTEALNQSRRLLRRYGDSEYKSLIDLKIARANLKLANWKAAHEYLQKIISEAPDSLEAFVARQLLEEKEFYAVQVGAFLDRQRAEAVVEQLKAKGDYAYIVQTTSRDGRIFYRVRDGQLTVLGDAKKLEEKLSKMGYPTLIYP